MIEGIKCPPSTHRYKALGKIVYCERCADVQPLLMDEPESVSRETKPFSWPDASDRIEMEPPPEPTAAEMEKHIADLRRLAGLSEADAQREVEQTNLFGKRGIYDGELSELEVLNRSNERELSRVPVTEGYGGNFRDESLPSAGL